MATAGVPAEILRGDVARATAEEDTDDGDGWACRSAGPPRGPALPRPAVGRARRGAQARGVRAPAPRRRRRRASSAGARRGRELPRAARAAQAAAELRRGVSGGDAAGVAAVKVDPAFRKMILAVVSFRARRRATTRGGGGEKKQRAAWRTDASTRLRFVGRRRRGRCDLCPAR